MRRAVTILIAAVWMANGLYCKVLGQVPRHREIVARILGQEHPELFTWLIGFGEIGMAVWILSGLKRKESAILQIILVLTMNFIEFFLARDLLLWGPWNLMFSFLFAGVVYWWGLMDRAKAHGHECNEESPVRR